MTTGAEPSDDALLAAHVAGDPDAFSQLVARHRDRLWAVALRTSGHPEDAADALQDALVSAFRRASTFGGRSSVTTWLHRIVVNACLDRIRHQKVRAAQPLPDDLDRTPAAPVGVTAPADPADEALRTDLRHRLLAALAELPAEHRAALVLVDMEGFSVAEAAEILDCPTGTVKSRCSRGRARLRELLGDVRAGNREPPPRVQAQAGAQADPPAGPSTPTGAGP